MATTQAATTSIGVSAAVAAAIAIIAIASAARAAPVDLRVVDRDTGQVLRLWRHHGRLFVVGQPGDRYSLRVTNNTEGRVLVVMSVDGVNIYTGETASYGQGGYVFAPHQSFDVTGWRKSTTEVAAFAFAPLSQSYAARTGRPTDVGVIGMAVFEEKAYVPPPEPEASAGQWNAPRDAAKASPAMRLMAPPPPVAAPVASARGNSAVAAMAPREERLGTAHGAREWSVVNLVNFERASAYPRFIQQIEYDSYANLVASGVIRPYANVEHRPQPFPAYPDGAGYVPDPPDEP